MSDLHAAILDLHNELAQRECASTSIIKACAKMGKQLPEAIAAGLLTLGGHHAPVDKAMQVWRAGPAGVHNWETIPGFGSAWYKGEPDPIFETIHDMLDAEARERLVLICTEVSNVTKKLLFPNAAMYTAIVADRLGYDATFASSLLVRGRMDQWCLIWAQNYRGLA